MGAKVVWDVKKEIEKAMATIEMVRKRRRHNGTDGWCNLGSTEESEQNVINSYLAVSPCLTQAFTPYYS